MRCVRFSLASIGSALLLLRSAGLAFGQVPDTAKGSTATLIGHVVDTAGAAVADAEVLVARADDGSVLGTTKSDKRGRATVRHLPAGGPYVIAARKIGYGPARGEVELRIGDTLYVDFELPSHVMTLAPIEVTARRNAWSITADQFKPKQFRDAAIMLAFKRRYMLGDPAKCPPPILGQQRPWKRYWLDEIIFGDPFRRPDLPYVQRLYVNGVRVDRTALDGSAFPGLSVLDELRRIPLEEIAEIRHVDCRDQSVPFYMQYALYVTLKPPSKEVQDSILRSIMKRNSAPR